MMAYVNCIWAAYMVNRAQGASRLTALINVPEMAVRLMFGVAELNRISRERKGRK